MTSADGAKRSPKALRDRLLFGSILIAAIAGAVALDDAATPGLPSTILVALLAALSAIEVSAMIRSAGIDGFEKASIGLAIALVLGRAIPRIETMMSPAQSVSWLGRIGTAELGLAAFLVFAIFCVIRRRTQAAAQTLGGGALVLLVPTCLLFMLDVRFASGRADSEGLRLLLFLVIVAKVGDISGYFVGTQLGSHKLIPAVSPGKTWEGSIASLAASTAVGAALHSIPFARPLTLETLNSSVVAAVAINLAAQLGDLVESLLKRGCGVKDSGRWIPQFGGVFDLTDSFFVSAPVFYGFLRFVR